MRETLLFVYGIYISLFANEWHARKQIKTVLLKCNLKHEANALKAQLWKTTERPNGLPNQSEVYLNLSMQK